MKLTLLIDGDQITPIEPPAEPKFDEAAFQKKIADLLHMPQHKFASSGFMAGMRNLPTDVLLKMRDEVKRQASQFDPFADETFTAMGIVVGIDLVLRRRTLNP